MEKTKGKRWKLKEFDLLKKLQTGEHFVFAFLNTPRAVISPMAMGRS